MDAANMDSFIIEMKSLIESKYKFLTDMLNKIGWKLENLDSFVKGKSKDTIYCPFNSDHKMAKEYVSKHILKCERKHGSFPFQPGLHSPKTYSSLISPSETQSCSGNQSLLNTELSDMNTRSDKKTTKNAEQLLELLAAERDAKRRRAAHRGKRVHTNRKTYSEVLREVIANQMDMLMEEKSLDERVVTEKNAKDISDEHGGSDQLEYIDVGCSFFSGNPYKRWQTIEQEEKELLEAGENLPLSGIRTPRRDRHHDSYKHYGKESDKEHENRSSSSARHKSLHYHGHRYSDYDDKSSRSTTGHYTSRRKKSDKRSPSATSTARLSSPLSRTSYDEREHNSHSRKRKFGKSHKHKSHKYSRGERKKKRRKHRKSDKSDSDDGNSTSSSFRSNE